MNNYHKVTKNIPIPLIQFIKYNLDNTKIVRLQNIKLNDLDLLHRKRNNEILRLHLVNMMYPGLPKKEIKR